MMAYTDSLEVFVVGKTFKTVSQLNSTDSTAEEFVRNIQIIKVDVGET